MNIIRHKATKATGRKLAQEYARTGKLDLEESQTDIEFTALAETEAESVYKSIRSAHTIGRWNGHDWASTIRFPLPRWMFGSVTAQDIGSGSHLAPDTLRGIFPDPAPIGPSMIVLAIVKRIKIAAQVSRAESLCADNGLIPEALSFRARVDEQVKIIAVLAGDDPDLVDTIVRVLTA